MNDGRSLTSRANLGDHIPEAIAPEGTTRITTVIPAAWLDEIDAAVEVSGATTRSAWLRKAIAELLLLDDA